MRALLFVFVLFALLIVGAFLFELVSFALPFVVESL